MTTNLEQPNGDTIAYSAMCRYVEAMNTLTELWNQFFKNLRSGRPNDEALMAQIKVAEEDLQQIRARHEATRDWALAEALPKQSTVAD